MTPDPEQRLPRELLKELIEEGSDAFRGVLEKLLNTAMQMEREEFLGARRWERSEQRRDHANGYKAKTLSTRVGQLQIRIPQVRHLDFYPRSLERGCRSEKALKLAIAEMYVMGVSTRKVTEITEQLCGTEISASQVSRISKLLDDELEQFRNRPLGSYPVVYLDAHYEKVRRQGSIQDVAVLKATGVNCWGKREVIGVSCRLSEAEVHWREFLQQLQKRGLEGVQLIVSDDHSGLRAARRAVFPSVPWQRCQFHLSQNAQQYARRSDQRAAIATDIRDIFNAPSGGEAEAMLRARVEQYYDRNPELADWMETNLPEGFTVFRFARSTWRRIRTNNGLENLNRQIRRRTRVVGIFPNTESALRLITAVVEEDSRRLADRETVPQPGRFQTTGESDLRSLSVKLQKNSCLARAGPSHADVFDLLRCAAHGPGRHGPESGPDGAVHPARRRRASGACREDGARRTRGVSGSLAPDRAFKPQRRNQMNKTLPYTRRCQARSPHRGADGGGIHRSTGPGYKPLAPSHRRIASRVHRPDSARLEPDCHCGRGFDVCLW